MNQTNIAEARVGAQLAEIDMSQVEKNEDDTFTSVKKEEAGDDDGGLSQLAAFIKTENPEAEKRKDKPGRPRNDGAIQAILSSAGVQYTHENSEVIGSSKVEAQLSRRAEMVADTELDETGDQSALFDEDNQASGNSTHVNMSSFTPQFNPPQDVMQRQFCSMAKEFGYDSVTDFALAVEEMTQEKRRDTLDSFYKNRMIRLLKEELERGKDVDEKKVDLLKAEVNAFEDQKVKTYDEDEGVKIKPEASEHRVGGHGESRLEDFSQEETKTEPKEEFGVTNKTGTAKTFEALSATKPMQSIFIYDDDDDDDESEL